MITKYSIAQLDVLKKDEVPDWMKSGASVANQDQEKVAAADDSEVKDEIKEETDGNQKNR